MHRDSSPSLGILYAEDFGDDVTPAMVDPTPPPPPLTQADVEAACAHAVDAARAAWAEDATARRTVALETLAAGFADAQAAAAHQAEAVADGIARTALTVIAGALPRFCHDHGDAEVEGLLSRLLPLVAGQTRVVVRVHPGLAHRLSEDLATLGEDVMDHVEVRPANLAPGDARLAWENGGLSRDSAAICAAIQDSLAQLGLFTPPRIPGPVAAQTAGTPAHAQ